MIVGHDSGKPLDLILVNSPLKDYDHYPRRHDFTLPVLGLGYIATCSREAGFNVGVLDAESLGLGIREIASIIERSAPRWVGLNLLAPTYRNSVKILQNIPSNIEVMLGGHQAKAMPQEILRDRSIPRIDAMVLGEGEARVKRLLADTRERNRLPLVYWRSVSGELCEGKTSSADEKNGFLAPNINELPFIDRSFLIQDPFKAEDGRVEANLVGSRGCPYECSFCGAAKSANPDISIRTRSAENILLEMDALSKRYNATAFRFVDDLFLADIRFMKICLPRFIQAGVRSKWVWDATGRINVLARADESLVASIVEAGCREVALGIESGSNRMLQYIDKHITSEMTIKAVRAVTERGINVKGYFILGFPTETEADLNATVTLIHQLWDATENTPGRFRCSVFEFRPYPGTPEWVRLIASGRFSIEQLLNYEHVDLVSEGLKAVPLERDEFNFSVNIQFGEVPINRVRDHLADLMREQKSRAKN